MEHPIYGSHWQDIFYFVKPFCIHYFIRFPQQLYILVLLSLSYGGGKWDSGGLSDLTWGHADSKWLNFARSYISWVPPQGSSHFALSHLRANGTQSRLLTNIILCRAWSLGQNLPGFCRLESLIKIFGQSNISKLIFMINGILQILLRKGQLL